MDRPLDNSPRVCLTVKPCIIWLDTWTDLPAHLRDIASGEEPPNGIYDKRTRAIYALKGRTSQVTICHETYHATRHRGREWAPSRPSLYVIDELYANKYAYSQLGRPRHVFSRLKEYYRQLVVGQFSIRPSKALTLIRAALILIDAPIAWHKDLDRLITELQQAWDERHDNKESIYYKDISPESTNLPLDKTPKVC